MNAAEAALLNDNNMLMCRFSRYVLQGSLSQRRPPQMTRTMPNMTTCKVIKIEANVFFFSLGSTDGLCQSHLAPARIIKIR